jgi:hypothetical protein
MLFTCPHCGKEIPLKIELYGDGAGGFAKASRQINEDPLGAYTDGDFDPPIAFAWIFWGGVVLAIIGLWVYVAGYL